MHHSAAIFPSELTASDNDGILDRPDVKHSAGELSCGERRTFLFTSLSRSPTDSYDDRDRASGWVSLHSD